MSPIDKWIAEGNDFEIKMIDSSATWDVSEIIYIDRFRQAGSVLLNVVRGGRDTHHDILYSAEGPITGAFNSDQLVKYLDQWHFWQELNLELQKELVEGIIAILK
jgi:hypothetical protein